MAGRDRRDDATPLDPEPVDSVVLREVFGDRGPTAQRYAEILVGDGVDHGLLGPREAPRIWSRHVFNCAAVSELIEHGSSVVDVGSGAGLPGLPIAIRRPDVSVTLVEPMQRRVEFLRRAVVTLGLGDQVAVLRGRADDPEIRSAIGPVSVVTARAVAPLARLVGWCAPLLDEQGRLVALKGASAATELDRDGVALCRLGLQGEVRLLSVAGAEVTAIEVRRRRDR